MLNAYYDLTLYSCGKRNFSISIITDSKSENSPIKPCLARESEAKAIKPR
jgi:hypothetical protein